VQGGDLGTWDQPRILLVLEDTLAKVTGSMERKGVRKVWVPNDPDSWEWGFTSLKTIQRYSYNSVPVEVITYISAEVAELAAVWFNKYDVEVASVEYVDLKAFQRSLIWRHNSVQRVIDSNPERLLHYGQRGHQIMFDSEF
jgi:hypothetical protein